MDKPETKAVLGQENKMDKPETEESLRQDTEWTNKRHRQY
jgi:hypothetical protein